MIDKLVIVLEYHIILFYVFLEWTRNDLDVENVHASLSKGCGLEEKTCEN